VREKRRKIRCQILKLRRDFTEMALDFFQRQIASDVEVAKLNLLAEWRKKNAEIEKRIGDGTISKRRFGNVLDIGNRGSEKPFRGQGDDVSWGGRKSKMPGGTHQRLQSQMDRLIAELLPPKK
jgi:hypothetical protein